MIVEKRTTTLQHEPPSLSQQIDAKNHELNDWRGAGAGPGAHPAGVPEAVVAVKRRGVAV
jgi:hypothetical protein